MEFSKRSIRIKELIKDEVCMGTYGLVELELKEFDKRIHFLETIIKEGLGEEDLKNDITYPSGD